MISIVIPIYNEEETISALCSRLNEVFNKVDEEFEVIFVDDGSKDTSLMLINDIHNKNNRYKALSFSRNFGHQAAVTAGLMYAKGDAVIIIDGDLQDPPEIIPQFIDKWRGGYQVVYGVRRKRKELILKRFAYFIFYRILRYIADINIPLDSGDFCLMDSKVVKLLNSLPERGRFVRGLRSWVGFKQVGLEFDRDQRFVGKSKYSFWKLLKLAFDGIFSFSEIPLKMVMLAGFIISGMSFVFVLYVVFNFFLGIQMYLINKNPGWASLIVSITFLGGIQLIAIGILGEYLARVFEEVKRRPHFIIDGLIGIENKIVDNE